METILIVTASVLFVFCAVLFSLYERARKSERALLASATSDLLKLREEHDRKIMELSGRLTASEQELQASRTLQASLKGAKAAAENRQVETRIQLDSLNREMARIEREKSLLEQKEASRQKEISTQLQDLENSRLALDRERDRISAEEKQRRQEYELNRDRVWAVHEQESIARMREVCSSPDYGFTDYDNTKLPEGFDRKLKPDFMVEFLGQYIIFDAKLSRSGKLQGYIQTQVKQTAAKLKASASLPEIYPTVFFVVPTQDISQMRTFSYFERGFNFFIIPIEAFEPILSVFRRLREYDLAEAYDPKERESVVNLIAAFDNHIRQQNAVNILNTLRGIRVMTEKQTLPPDLNQSIDEKRKALRIDTYKPSELHRLINDPTKQMKEIADLVNPSEPAVNVKDISHADRPGEGQENDDCP